MEVPITEIWTLETQGKYELPSSVLGNSTEQLLGANPLSHLSSTLGRSVAWVILPISTCEHVTPILKTRHGICILPG